MMRSATAKSGPISVAIVGAGFAGLRCADVLLKKGVKVSIFEARNRVGGRVAQSRQLGHIVDLGPNWIHGSEDNPMFHIAKATGTTLHEWNESLMVIDRDGTIMDAHQVSDYAEKIWEDIIPNAFKLAKERNETIDPKTSLYDFFIERAATMFQDEPNEIAERKRTTLLEMGRVWGSYIGSPYSRQSLKFFWLEECIEGENPFVAGTYEKILGVVKKPAEEQADIKLNSEVSFFYGRGSEKSAGIQTVDGVCHEFDEVVVTTPLGWLKSHKDAFKPALDPRLSQAIDNISYGSLDKVYITFPSAFWDMPPAPNPLPPNNLNPTPEPPNIKPKPTPLDQPPLIANETHHHPPFTHWLSPTYAPDTNPQGWDCQAMNMAGLPGETAHATLLYYIHGANSKHIAELVQTTPDATSLDEKLTAYFKPYYSLLPNYSATDPNCVPKAVLATAWAADEFAGFGSYANFQVGLEQGDEDVETMRRGMPERGIWLAGEHTAPFVALGTTTGAYWSGEAVAKRILKVYGLEEVV
ncbi:Hypothetical protein R9X50_00545000 [Acrodontium crateriforme]|uniref:Amine oxidase domain-containing protein n=1 Tax=Acrodontium crateriforme TaxID=150365 RepID=A0AAQ3M7Z0_9PEZI|nr:Hypothetical protein R9X50_00545000 [Acrodontium crateriforme]